MLKTKHRDTNADANLCKSMHRIINFYAGAPMQFGEYYHP